MLDAKIGVPQDSSANALVSLGQPTKFLATIMECDFLLTVEIATLAQQIAVLEAAILAKKSVLRDLEKRGFAIKGLNPPVR